MSTVDDLFRRFPEGWTVRTYRGRRYGVTRTTTVGGRVQKLYAEELGGADVISANLYDGDRLQPCEMPAATVLAFLTGAEPGPEPGPAAGVPGATSDVPPDAGPDAGPATPPAADRY